MSTAYSEIEEIDCPAGFPATGAACLAKYYDPSSATLTRRSNAVFASEAIWELTTTIYIKLEGPGDVPIGGLVRTMTGSRIRHKLLGQIIPFFSVHLSTKNAAAERKKNQLRNMVAAVRQAWQPGDLPPIIVGDFNCGGPTDPEAWTREICGLIYRDFYEASGQHSIDLVFVGRPDRWQGAGGIIVPAIPVSGEPVSGRYDPGDLSDHHATWVLLHWQLTPASALGAPTAYIDHQGRGCRPVL